MEDIEDRIFLKNDLSKLDALSLEQGTDVISLLCFAYAFLMPLSMCLPLAALMPVWAALCLAGLRHTKPFLKTIGRMVLYRFVFWTLIVWFAVGLIIAAMIFSVPVATLVFRNRIGRPLSFFAVVSFGGILGNIVYILLMVLLYKYFEILFQVFHKKSKMAKARAYLIAFCTAALVGTNGMGLVYLPDLFGDGWMGENPLITLVAPVAGLVTAIAVILCFIVAPLMAILFFRQVRQILPRIRGLYAGEGAFEDAGQGGSV